MGLLGQGVLAIWNDIAPGGDDEFNHWHIPEHIPERVAVPGFLRGRRYVALSGAPKYFTLYETESVATLGGPAYLARLDDPTPLTRRSLPLFRNTRRTACRVTRSLGVGVGGTLATVELGPRPGADQELRAWLVATTLSALAGRPGVVGAHLCEADEGITRVETKERRLRDRPDELARWVILLEAIEGDVVESGCREFLNPSALARHGASEDTALATYRLQYVLARE